MLDLTLAVKLSDRRIHKLDTVMFLHCLVKVHDVRVRAGQVSKGVLHVVLYFVIVLVHSLIVFLLFLLILHRNELLVTVKGFLFSAFNFPC